MSYEHLKLKERYVIAHLKIYGLSIQDIARRIDRSASTISRELKRNKGKYQEVYWYEDAQKWSEERRSRSMRPTKLRNEQLYKYIVQGLQMGWSPELISGRMRREYRRQNKMRISVETIYRWYTKRHRREEGYTSYYPAGTKGGDVKESV